jgi:hypothetical protein
LAAEACGRSWLIVPRVNFSLPVMTANIGSSLREISLSQTGCSIDSTNGAEAQSASVAGRANRHAPPESSA